MSSKTAFFTGHRHINLFYQPVIDQMIDYAISQGVNHFLSGMAIGTDTIAATTLIKRNLPWTAVIPFIGQEKRWPIQQQQHYQFCLDSAQQVIVIDKAFSKEAYFRRNNYMVNHSYLGLAVFDGRPGGTDHAVKYAKSKRLKLFIYNLQTQRFQKWIPA